MSFEYDFSTDSDGTPTLETDPCPHCGSRILTVRWIEVGQFVGYPEDSKYNSENDREAELDDWYPKPEVDRIHCDDCNTVLVE